MKALEMIGLTDENIEFIWEWYGQAALEANIAIALATMRALVAEIEKRGEQTHDSRTVGSTYWGIPIRWWAELKAALEEK